MRASYSQIRMMSFAQTLAFGLVLLSAACSPENTEIAAKYPETRRSDTVDIYHGVSVSDPYQWLESVESDEVTNWIAQQAGLTEAAIKTSNWSTIRSRIAELEDFEVYSAPLRAGDSLFYSSWPSFANNLSSIQMRAEGSNLSRTIIEPPYHFDESTDVSLLRFSGFVPSPDGQRLAYSASADGSMWMETKIVDTGSGKQSVETLTGMNAAASGPLSWRQDGSGFFYVGFDVPDDADKISATPANGRVYFHRLGTDQSDDMLITDPGMEHGLLLPAASADGQYLIVSVLDTATQTNQVLVESLADEVGESVDVFSGRQAVFSYLGNEGSRFWFYTNEDAPNGKIILRDLSDGSEITVVEESAIAMSAGSFVGGNALGKFGDTLVVMFVQDASPLIRIFDLNGQLLHTLNLPLGGSVWGGFQGRSDAGELFFRYLGMFDPSTIYRVDPRAGSLEEFIRSDTGPLPRDYVIEKIFYPSADGTQVPMFISHKKGLTKNGRNRSFLYGYGAFGWNSFLFYQSHLIAWLEAGGVYAQPGLRGGGEYGQEWHAAGSGLNKQNAIDDFIAAAEWLIQTGYTSPEMLAANGGSASAMTAAAAVQQRPDLFAASIIDRPALDMLRFEKFTNGRFWLKEFGTPSTREEFEALYSYSPYHTLGQQPCYPASLIIVGEKDQTVSPMHGYKYAAKLQNVQSCDNAALLYVMPNTGHNFGSTVEEVVNTRTAEVAFLLQKLDLGLPDSWTD